MVEIQQQSDHVRGDWPIRCPLRLRPRAHDVGDPPRSTPLRHRVRLLRPPAAHPVQQRRAAIRGTGTETGGQFYAETAAALRDLDLDVAIRATPTEVERAIPFEDDYEHAAYDPDAAHRFWRQLLQAHRVLSEFRSRFIGKISPVHYFWGSFDMALTRFSGRTAPTHPGGAPNCPDWVMVEGYSHELSSCGFWPGCGDEGVFYAYAYPEPDGFRGHPIRPDAAYYSSDAGQFLLPYEAIRTAPDPDHTLLECSCRPPTRPPQHTLAGTATP